MLSCRELAPSSARSMRARAWRNRFQPLKLRPTGLGHGVYKDNIDYNVFSGEWLIGRIYERNGFGGGGPKKSGFACRWGLLGLVIPVDQHDLRCITGSGHAPGVGG